MALTHEMSSVFPLQRPVTLAACARYGARRYRRNRDLPGAVPGLLAGDPGAILPRLIAEEHDCEEARRARSADYRPARHVQILSALLAEAAAIQIKDTARMAAPKALILRNDPIDATGRRPDAQAGGRARAPYTKASGSDALRLAM